MKMNKIFDEIGILEIKSHSSTSLHLCKLTEEIGELATEINKLNGIKKHNEHYVTTRKNIIEESADSIQCIFAILNNLNISYEELKEILVQKNNKWKSYL